MASGRERAYQFLKDSVLSDPDMQGQFINEQDLADRIGVSRTPIREALLMLAAEDLIRLVPKKGAYVPAVTPRELAELFELREVLESHAAGALIARGGIEALEPMWNAYSRQAELVERAGQLREFIEQDHLFHSALVAAAGNQLYSRVYEGLRARQIVAGITAVYQGQARQREVLREHREILAALESGNLDTVHAAIRAHLAATLNVLLAR
ncbi:DNA-binding GntR family transcriptional regulator [Crossiella equi]|uniref:DNA-binding GntR family transcriptional regulator n=1 Tax=Crossiella equi TaxID=130796 RepID=A0ABS5AL21_9PSEU|nr:GntR family transcriptional regulator [Crossiella equi]MBP2477270.1 DNA-binding GntR family transcriptional regulator [Crossiella equi]